MCAVSPRVYAKTTRIGGVAAGDAWGYLLRLGFLLQVGSVLSEVILVSVCVVGLGSGMLI